VLTAYHVCIGRDVPIAAAAIHDGHALREDVRAAIALRDDERLREEDPHTAEWTRIVDTRLVGRRSRFEVDLNRSRQHAVYQKPSDAWGLNVWRVPLPASAVEESLRIYDAFYAAAEAVLDDLCRRWPRVAVLDLHSYNHRRAGPHAPPDDPVAHPEVNIGTGSMDRERWAPVVDALMQSLRSTTVRGRALDVRENVKFQGGHFPQWIHEAFPGQVCAIAVEFRKSFMDEWTGHVDWLHVGEIGQALAGVVPAVSHALAQVRD
jgi:N-formylglutamate deformylase